MASNHSKARFHDEQSDPLGNPRKTSWCCLQKWPAGTSRLSILVFGQRISLAVYTSWTFCQHGGIYGKNTTAAAEQLRRGSRNPPTLLGHVPGPRFGLVPLGQYKGLLHAAEDSQSQKSPNFTQFFKMSYLYKLMDSGQVPGDNEEPLTGPHIRQVSVDGSPTDVLHIKFKGSGQHSRKWEPAEIAEDQSYTGSDDTVAVVEPLEPADGRYWADLSPSERRRFYYEDEKRVRSCFLKGAFVQAACQRGLEHNEACRTTAFSRGSEALLSFLCTCRCLGLAPPPAPATASCLHSCLQPRA